ncbi:GNAT family N-acetyltransferase [Salinimicrobium tongyeongense]|uniref:GNAT family N-acetyltransferase n=1 Tax=Salinimicrobium tongyeongense TaxID=2809707 RepID=A0ABY6NQA6_9FLAO|nr:GNAT family N-acetyltransferase [Salinimicrobium tongyeongense]UZH55062.1 GNAT family N-acetyltransferase [Salinimicrobium tongyeongense]
MNPLAVFETERLLLRPAAPQDAAFIYELLNSPKWLKFIGDRDLDSVSKAEAYIIEKMLPQLKKLGFTNNIVIRKSDGAKMGTCGLNARSGFDDLDIGFAFLPQFEKQGYAFEAAGRIMRFAREELPHYKVTGITSKENLASQKLLEKLGMRCAEEISFPGETEKVLLFRLP